jgi:hypothetical protein
MSRWVLLLHELPDRSWHYDWMIQPSGAMSDARLISFRVLARPDDPSLTDFSAERIGDHRADYLSFEGQVSAGRGRVRRVGEGQAEVLRDDVAFVVTLDDRRTWIGQRRGVESPEYHFHLSTGPWIGHTDERPGV